jgi:hypothetical protein
MARTASPVTSPATLTAVDADGDDFALDFGMTDLAGKPATPAVETDKVAAALAADTVANHYRAEHYKLA